MHTGRREGPPPAAFREGASSPRSASPHRLSPRRSCPGTPQASPRWETWQYTGTCQNHSGSACDCDKGCCDVIYCDALFCAPCQIARQLAALGLFHTISGLTPGQHTDEQPLQLGALLCGCEVVWLAAALICPMLRLCNLPVCAGSAYVSKEVRERYGLDGTSRGDVICGWFCAPCLLVRTHKELSLRGSYPGVACCGRYCMKQNWMPEKGPPGYRGHGRTCDSSTLLAQRSVFTCRDSPVEHHLLSPPSPDLTGERAAPSQQQPRGERNLSCTFHTASQFRQSSQSSSFGRLAGSMCNLSDSAGNASAGEQNTRAPGGDS